MKKDRPAKKPARDKTLRWAGLAAIVAVFLLSMPFWATDDKDAATTLAAFDLTPVAIGGFDAFGCGFDLYATRFQAKTAKGQIVHGDVCRTPMISGSRIELHNER